MSTWFTSDLHLGHYSVGKTRGFDITDEHDYTLVENINSKVNKRDKLFILGDLAFTDKGLHWLDVVRCRNIELILGNHDKYPLRRYMEHGITKFHGFRGYKNYWLSHCPIHPNEIRKKTGNIHGHIHTFGDTEKIIDPRYYNVNVEFHDLHPVSLEEIERHFKEKNDE